jgi:chromate transporter
MRTIAAHFRSRQHDLKPEVRFDLLPQSRQRLAEKLLHLATTQTDHVGMLLLAPRLVEVLFARLMHQIQLIHQAAFFQQLQRPVNRHPVELWIFLLRHLIKPFGVQMLPRFVDQIEQNLPLAGQPHPAVGQGGFRGRSRCGRCSHAAVPVYRLGLVLRSKPVRDLIRLFLRLGFTAFGGPAAHIAMMKDDVVTRRRWMSEAEFLDFLGATYLIPGPNSTQMAIHIGYRRAGWPGLLAAGLCFILPAAAIVLLCAWAYKRYGSLPQTQAILYGVKPVIIAIISNAIRGLGRAAVKTWFHAFLGIAALALSFLGVDVLVLLFAAGAISAARRPLRGLLPVLAISATMIAVPDALTRLSHPSPNQPYSAAALFAFFLKVGMTLYGGGYVLLAFVRDGLVHQWHWLTEAQLLDAIAVGQFTPGPLFTTATFVGYLVGGFTGAWVATLAIFLPSFILIAISGPLVPLLRRSKTAAAFLDGVNVSALALMAAVTVQLARAALVDVFTVLLAVTALIVLLRYRINSAWLICAGALSGTIIKLL